VLDVKTNFQLGGEWPLLHFVVRNVQIEHSRPNGVQNNSVLNATIGHEQITGLLMQISEADCALLSLEWECAHLDINHRKIAGIFFKRIWSWNWASLLTCVASYRRRWTENSLRHILFVYFYCHIEHRWVFCTLIIFIGIPILHGLLLKLDC